MTHEISKKSSFKKKYVAITKVLFLLTKNAPIRFLQHMGKWPGKKNQQISDDTFKSGTEEH